MKTKKTVNDKYSSPTERMNKKDSDSKSERCRKDYAADRLACGISTAGDYIGAARCQMKAYDKYDKCRTNANSSINGSWGEQRR